MKKIFPVIAILVLFVSRWGFSQSIGNGGFESWTPVTWFSEPAWYNTSNPLVFYSGASPNVTASTDAHSGNFSLKLESVETNDGPYFGAAFIGEFANDTISGGMPYTERPDSVTGWVKYDIMPDDTAFMAVLFKKFGAPLGICTLAFYGSQPQFTYFSAPVTWFVPIISPDSLFAGFVSSSIDYSAVPGSVIWFDDITLTGVNSNIPNSGFEDWDDFGAEEPDEWLTSNVFNVPAGEPGITKSNNAHSGSWSAQLTTTYYLGNDTVTYMTNADYLTEEGNPVGGMALQEFPEKVTGYYKYSPSGSDTAIAGLWLFHNDSVSGSTQTLEETIIPLLAANEWTAFEIPVSYYASPVPDTLAIAFSPSNLTDNSQGVYGSTLWIDDLEITYQPFITGIQDVPGTRVSSFPNPAHSSFNIEINRLIDQPVRLILTDINGKVVLERIFSSGKPLQQISAESLKPGIYFYKVEWPGRTITGKQIIH
ncbi:MAG: hypothetical protein Kow00127_16540 [Bacteroidales bacterium]